MKLPPFAVILIALLGSMRADDLQAPLFSRGEVVLFQGDSITDMGRGRSADPNHLLGHGYVFLIAARQGSLYPESHLSFLNRGVSGNRVGDLAQRWQVDTLDLKPDVLSILVGINDVFIALMEGKTVSVEEYERTYDKLLADAVAAKPGIKLILGEPFLLKGKRNEARLGEWQATVARMRTAVARLGEKYHAPVVRFQAVFDAALKRAPIEYWIWDGIHPTYAGHQLMAEEWARVYRAFYGAPAAR